MLQLSFDAEPDQHRVFDGQDLARAMITYAYRQLMAYVDNCPACADNLFSVIANEAIEKIHKERDAGFLMMTPPEDPAMKQLHIKEAEKRTRQLLAGSAPHPHE